MNNPKLRKKYARELDRFEAERDELRAKLDREHAETDAQYERANALLDKLEKAESRLTAAMKVIDLLQNYRRVPNQDRWFLVSDELDAFDALEKDSGHECRWHIDQDETRCLDCGRRRLPKDSVGSKAAGSIAQTNDAHASAVAQKAGTSTERGRCPECDHEGPTNQHCTNWECPVNMCEKEEQQAPEWFDIHERIPDLGRGVLVRVHFCGHVSTTRCRRYDSDQYGLVFRLVNGVRVHSVEAWRYA